MRFRRYVPLGLAVVLVLVGLAWIARRHFAELARERARGLRNALADRVAEGRADAGLLAGLAPADIERALAHLRHVARVRVFDADGRCVFHAERVGYLVARMPPARLGGGARVAAGAVSGLERDADRLDVAPALRHVFHYGAARPDGGLLEMTLYAEPFLKPVRAAGGTVLDAAGRPLLGTERPADAVEVAGPSWTVVLPRGRDGTAAAALVGVAAAVLVLGGAGVLLSERQLRAQERAALERELAQADRLRSLGLLTAGLAHEINNPLEGIANWLRLGNVAKAEEGFRRIREIVRDLLAFARPRETEDAAAAPAAAFAKALDLARHGDVLRDVEVASAIPGDLVVRAPARVLEQVFLNLLLNAGRVARRIEASSDTADGRVRVHVDDSGPGVPPAERTRVFDPFHSGGGGGTGLGLSVSYGLVSAWGGVLSVDAAPLGGARFTVELPAR